MVSGDGADGRRGDVEQLVRQGPGAAHLADAAQQRLVLVGDRVPRVAAGALLLRGRGGNAFTATAVLGLPAVAAAVKLRGAGEG